MMQKYAFELHMLDIFYLNTVTTCLLRTKQIPNHMNFLIQYSVGIFLHIDYQNDHSSQAQQIVLILNISLSGIFNITVTNINEFCFMNQVVLGKEFFLRKGKVVFI